MFSWTCKICGRDNPPSAQNCLSCGARFDAEPETAGGPEPEPEPVPEIRTPPVSPQEYTRPHSDPQPTYAPPVSRPAARELPPRPVQARSAGGATTSGMPTWALTILFFLAIIGVGAGVYYAYTYFSNRKQATSTGLDPAANVARTKLSNPLQKYVEVVGIRLVQDSKRKPEARFIVVNHSPNTLDEMSATVTLWASTSRSEEDSTGTFTFKVPSIGPYGSKELTAPLNTKLKFYELPDWQNATPELQITSP